MRILQLLTYYRPHISGLTIYVERLARALAAEGHTVTVLTSQYDPALPREETLHGVRVVRAPVLMRVSKGVIMPTFGVLARRLMRSHDVVHIHLPQFDGAGLAINARLFGKPSLLTYHCDIRLPAGVINAVAQPVIALANRVAGALVNRVVTYRGLRAPLAFPHALHPQARRDPTASGDARADARRDRRLSQAMGG